MPYDARAVANYFLDLARQEGRTLDPMGVQKLVYFAHGWHLALLGTPLVKQPVEAWDYGPVIADLYQGFRSFGREPIQTLAVRFEYNPESHESCLVIPQIDDTPETERTRALLNKVWDSYKALTSIQLSNLTHVPGSPWTIARKEKLRDIDNSTIAEYFKSQARSNADSVQ